MKNLRIAVIGCGNIGQSIIEGIIKRNVDQLPEITATRRNLVELDHLKSQGIRVTSDNLKAVQESDLIVIAVKSYNFSSILSEISSHLQPGRHILISVTTGISTDQILKATGNRIPVFRAMPNISASIGSSVTCLSYSAAADEDVESVKLLFDIIGTSMIIDESLMESATILGSCGVAYVLRFIRAMIQGGIQIGFDAVTASAIVNQTVKGAAELLIERRQHPEQEIDKVTTPKGCTIVGLNEMEHNGFSSSLIKGIVASFEKIER